MTIPFPKSSGADCSAHKHPRRWLREAGESPNFALHFRTVSTGLPVQAAGLRHFSAGSPSFRPKPRLSAILIRTTALFCCLFFPLAVGPETCYTYYSVERYLQEVSHVWKRFSIPCIFSPSSLLCLQSGFIRVFYALGETGAANAGSAPFH